MFIFSGARIFFWNVREQGSEATDPLEDRERASISRAPDSLPVIGLALAPMERHRLQDLPDKSRQAFRSSDFGNDGSLRRQSVSALRRD